IIERICTVAVKACGGAACSKTCIEDMEVFAGGIGGVIRPKAVAAAHIGIGRAIMRILQFVAGWFEADTALDRALRLGFPDLQLTADEGKFIAGSEGVARVCIDNVAVKEEY